MRPPVIATRTGLLAATAVLGCIPSVTLEPAKLVAHDCRGPFAAEVPVVRRGVRKIAVVYELTPGEYNVADVVRSPERETIAGKPGRSKIEVTGNVADTCEDAGLHVFASYVPGGHAGFVGIPSVVAAEGLATPKSDPVDGAFAYPIELTCCGEDRSGPYAVRVRGIDNVAAVAAEPSTVTCAGSEQHLISIRGRLAAPAKTARVHVEVESTDTGDVCTIEDELGPNP
jgi:hypothetical protein